MHTVRGATIRGRTLVGMLATLLVVAGCDADVSHGPRMSAVAPVLATQPAAAAGLAPPAWLPARRSMQGANQWVLAGEATSRELARTHPTVLFVGDSITQWWTRYGMATWKRDFAPLGAVQDGVAGDTTSNLLFRLEAGGLVGIHPRVVVTLIGTNNIPLGQPPEEIVRGILAVVDVLQARVPGARILLLGLLPRGRPGSSERLAVAAVNRLLARGVPAGVTYLDPAAALLQPPGATASSPFRPGAMHSDLLHPAPGGYAMLGARLAPEVRALLTTAA